MVSLKLTCWRSLIISERGSLSIIQSFFESLNVEAEVALSAGKMTRGLADRRIQWRVQEGHKTIFANLRKTNIEEKIDELFWETFYFSLISCCSQNFMGSLNTSKNQSLLWRYGDQNFVSYHFLITFWLFTQRQFAKPKLSNFYDLVIVITKSRHVHLWRQNLAVFRDLVDQIRQIVKTSDQRMGFAENLQGNTQCCK